MSYLTDGLTFNTLREANKHRRLQEGAAYARTNNWTPAQWLQAVVGELGEYANIRKKFERGDFAEEEFKALAAMELADTITYMDILAEQLGINLGAATLRKFNIISARIGSNIFIRPDGSDWTHSPRGTCDGLHALTVPCADPQCWHGEKK